jgi:hypothetical protein
MKKPPSGYALSAHAGGDRLDITYSSRDLRMLGGPFLPEGEIFIVAIGVWDNLSVANGQAVGAFTSKRCVEVRVAAEGLLRRLVSDALLLQHDYMFSIPPTLPGRQGGSIAGLRPAPGVLPFRSELVASVHARRPGQIYVSLVAERDGAWHEAGYLDLRLAAPFATDAGTVRIHRRRVPASSWLSNLPKLTDLLSGSTGDRVEFRHHLPS